MNKIRITEIFKSIQGEGKYTGHSSIFIRNQHCNLRCSGFSVDPKDPNFNGPNQEVMKIIEQHKKKPFKCLTDCPLAKTGCDSYVSSYPEFADISPYMTIDETVEKIKSFNPTKKTHIVISGGEPLIFIDFYQKLIEKLHDTIGSTYFTFETNGTIILPDDFKTFVDDMNVEVLLSVSPKLACSGNTKEQAWKPKAIQSYMNLGDNFKIYYKFVVDDVESDMVEIKEYCAFVGIDMENTDIYLMPVGGTIEKDSHTKKVEVADFCIDNDFIFCDRLHLSLYGNKWST